VDRCQNTCSISRSYPCPVAEDGASHRRIGIVHECFVGDEFELAYSTPHKVWLPRPWPKGLGRRTFKLTSFEDLPSFEDTARWEVSTLPTTKTGRSFGISGATMTKLPQHDPSDIPSLPWPCWMSGFKISSEQSDIVELHYSLAVAVEGTMVTLFGTRQTRDATWSGQPPRSPGCLPDSAASGPPNPLPGVNRHLRPTETALPRLT